MYNCSCSVVLHNLTLGISSPCKGCVPITFFYFVASLLSSVSTLVSAYLLYFQFKVHDQICLPCIAYYFIHMLLFFVLAIRWTNSGSSGTAAEPVTGKSQQQQHSSGGKKGGASQKPTSKQANNKSKSETSSSDEASSRTKNSSGNAKRRKK